MSTVTFSALALLKASIQNSNSMKLSLTGKAVDCTRKTSLPLTFSRTRTKVFPSENRNTSPSRIGTSKWLHILVVRSRLPLPLKTITSDSIAIVSLHYMTHNVVFRGARHFARPLQNMLICHVSREASVSVLNHSISKYTHIMNFTKWFLPYPFILIPAAPLPIPCGPYGREGTPYGPAGGSCRRSSPGSFPGHGTRHSGRSLPTAPISPASTSRQSIR